MSVCPHLKRKDNRTYICSRINTTVNPFLAPCLSSFDECPFYKAPEELEARVEKPEAISTPPQPPSEKPAEVEVEILVEEKLRELEDAVATLDRLWSTYEESASKVVLSWHDYKRQLERRLASLYKELEDYEALVNELEVRHKLDIIDDTTYQRGISLLQGTIDRLRGEVERIEGLVHRIEELLAIHYKRIKPSILKVSPSKIKLGLLRLDELYKQGKIDAKLYERLRRELEEDYEILVHYG